MRRSRMLVLGGTVAALAVAAWLLRACYGAVVNREDRPAADRIVGALAAYHAARGGYPPTLDALVPEYLPELPQPRRFGSIGYAPLDGGRGCLVGYFTHRDYLDELDCGAKTWSPVEYDDSRLIKAPPTQWLRGPS